MIATTTVTNTPFGRTITVTASGRWIFKTLDDCFGMDRVRDWAKKNGVVLTADAKVA